MILRLPRAGYESAVEVKRTIARVPDLEKALASA